MTLPGRAPIGEFRAISEGGGRIVVEIALLVQPGTTDRV
jgi:hypothetical protein